jgi:SAM-dependent methyltransferase
MPAQAMHPAPLLPVLGARTTAVAVALGRRLKQVPIDFGQAALRETTMGKRIAMGAVPAAAPGATALDVGCREGIQSAWLASRGYRVTGVDKEPRCAQGIEVDLDVGLPFPDAHFDVVWCSEVIEHLRDPARTVGELRRVTKPGGLMVLTTPNSWFWLAWPLCLVGLTPRRVQNADHKHFFSLRAVRRLFPAARIAGYFPYALVKRRIERLVGLLSPTFVIVEQR